MPLLGLALVLLTLAGPVAAQDGRATSAEERQAYVARLQREAEADRQRMLAVLGVEVPTGLPTDEMPAPDVALTTGDLAFRNHEGGHTDAPDWPVFYDWVARYFVTE